MLTLTFPAFCDDEGHFSLTQTGHTFRTEVARLFKGKELVLTVTERRAKRSIDQNEYWWAVPVKILAEELGYTPSQMHYALLGECFGYREGPTGKAIPNVPSSSDLNVTKFKELIDWVLIFAPSELGIDIPPPDPNWKNNRAEVA